MIRVTPQQCTEVNYTVFCPPPPPPSCPRSYWMVPKFNRKWTEKQPFHTAKDKIITHLHTKKTGLLPLPVKTVWQTQRGGIPSKVIFAPYWPALNFRKIEFQKILMDQLDFLSISKLNFAGYTRSKILVQKRRVRPTWFFKLEFSTSKWEEFLKDICGNRRGYKLDPFKKNFSPLC
jgi:hypothetical protein